MSELEPEGTYRPQFRLRRRGVARILDRFPRLKSWGANRLRSFMGRFVIPEMITTERVVEYPFVFENLESATARVLDIGSAGSRLAIAAASRGARVVAIDFKPYPFAHPNLGRVRGDMMQAPFPDGTFDAVLAISVIEHVGIGHYGDPTMKRGDLTAVEEIARLLRPGGRAILSVPFGRPRVIEDFARIYDGAGLRELVAPLATPRFEFACSSRGLWTPCSEADAADIDWIGASRAVALVVASR